MVYFTLVILHKQLHKVLDSAMETLNKFLQRIILQMLQIIMIRKTVFLDQQSFNSSRQITALITAFYIWQIQLLI